MTDSDKDSQSTTLTAPFKVGDKVCDPVRHGNGKVSEIHSNKILVVFEETGAVISYDHDGKYFGNRGQIPTLFHGHMEEGTGQVTFTPKKEPVYEWQWEFVYTDYFGRHSVGITDYYKTEEAMLNIYAHKKRTDFIRIERSKREVIK